MSHECEECGQWCFCDLDDTALPQPSDCRHACDVTTYGDDDDYDPTRDADNGLLLNDEALKR